MNLNYIRISNDQNGETHFQDVTPALAAVDFAPPAPPFNVSPPMPSQRMLLASVPAGWVGDWHPTPQRQFAILLSGQLEVEVSDGELRRLGAGSVVLLEDVSGKGHLTRVVGDGEARLAFVQLS